MKGLSDIELLEAYSNGHSEEAFRELVERHVDVAYSAALRQLRDPHAAQEAVQSAFLALAGKAGQLPRGTLIAGWLHRAVHFAARNLRRAEARRRHWEDEAAMMHSRDEEDGGFRDRVLPHVDGALAELGDADRDAIVLRFLRQKSLRDVAQALGTSEDAAKKRVQRALERMRALLMRQGVAITVTLLAAGMAKMPVTAAPAGLTAALAGAAAQGAFPASAVTMAEGSSVLSTWMSAPAKWAVAAALVLGVGGIALLRPKSGEAADAATVAARRSNSMKIHISSVLVGDQEKALKFYTDILGFERKWDMPAGPFRWLTVAAKGRHEMELSLEPNANPDAKVFQEALFKQGIPLTSLGAVDVRREYERMKALGVVFTQEPSVAGETTLAVFQDTCGNLIQLHQRPAWTGVDAATAAGISIDLSSILVDDQEKALKFYTEILGLRKKLDIPVGAFRWLTLVAPGDPEGMQLVLEPNENPAAKVYQSALFQQGIPLTSLAVGDVQKAHDELVKKGVVFSMKPTRMGPTVMAMFEDTCGNRIQLVQQ